MSGPAPAIRILVCTLLAPPLTGCSLLFDSDEFDDEAADPTDPPGGEDGEGGASADAAPPADAGPSADAASSPDAPAGPADVAGTYTASITNGGDECGFPGWQEGAVATGVPLTVTQQAEAVTATVEGAPGALLDALFGSRVFQGELAGDELELTLFGTNAFTSGGCTFTVNGVVGAALEGDLLEGEIEYRPSTNGSPDCGVLETCASVQRFNGTRPPR